MVRGGQPFQKQAPEEAREHLDRKKETRSAGNPMLAVEREADARYDDVGVRMVGECRSPGKAAQSGRSRNLRFDPKNSPSPRRAGEGGFSQARPIQSLGGAVR
jgi:hypothetical protein